MDKLEKLSEDLEKAIAKRDEWERKVEDLSRKYHEEKSLRVMGLIDEANLDVEELARLIKMSRGTLPSEESLYGATKEEINE